MLSHPRKNGFTYTFMRAWKNDISVLFIIFQDMVTYMFLSYIVKTTSRVAGFDFLPFGGYKDPGEFFEITK